MAKILGVVLAVYVGIVVAFESWLGYSQPENQQTLIIHTFDDSEHKRVLRALDDNGALVVAVNHWPRAWFYRLQGNPSVKITMNDATSDYVAKTAEGAEHDRLADKFAVPITFRILTGFPPRYFVQLSPQP